jgi:hypothetical protein
VLMIVRRGAPLLPLLGLLFYLSLFATVAGAAAATWDEKWRQSQAAWEDDDGEVALEVLEQAFALHPPPDAEEKMFNEFVSILESIKSEKRALSAVENVHAMLSARHGVTPTNNNIVIQLASTLATAKAAMNDTHGALEHASQVVQASVEALQELDESLLPKLDEKGVEALEQSLSRMTALVLNFRALLVQQCKC